MPSVAGPILLGSRIHFTTFMLWTGFKLFGLKLGHSGFEIPWNPITVIPWSISASYHEFHHSHNVGNYAFMSNFWDTVFGTNADYMKYLEEENNSKIA